jgi:hypothetical protein
MNYIVAIPYLLVPAMIGGFLAHAPAVAREPAQSAASATEPACMVGTFGNAAHVAPERRGQSFLILTVARAVPNLETKGFARVDCAATDFAQADARKSWRSRICHQASEGGRSDQDRLEQTYGERPAVLCAMAEAVEGQWNGRDQG